MTAYTGPVPCASCGLPLPESRAGQARCVCGTEQQVLRFATDRVAAPPPVTELLEVAGRDIPCAYHARNAASGECSRCGSFICGLCALTVARRTLCPPCFERLRGAGQLPAARTVHPRPHAQALALALVSIPALPMSPVLAPLAIWLALRALGQREQLSERESGVEVKAVTALLVALLGLGLLAVLVLLVVRKAAK